jgi:predicted ATP-grasp superfamily ATP-dependent carboligase
MDIQEKKFKLIEDLEPMTLNELHIMVDKAKLDYQNGRVTSHEDLKKEVLTWK